MISKTYINTVATIVLALTMNLISVGSVIAGQVVDSPVSWDHTVSSLSAIPIVDMAPLDVNYLLQEDEMREEQELPFRFALPHNVNVSPTTDGQWERLSDGSRLWRLIVANPGAKSLNLGFTSFDMPYGAQLFIYAADKSGSVLVFGAEDNRNHQQLWTPILATDEVVVELVVPAGKNISAENLTLGVIGCGYREFGKKSDKAGSCNIDVVCSEGDPWRQEIRAEAVYSIFGSTTCSGSMINNTDLDGRPLFLTADHCNILANVAPSVVVYWNYESENCGDLGGGSMDQFTTGSTLLAEYRTTDMTLIELDALPDPVFGVTYAGWDRTDTDPVGAVAIHSPGADEKCISFDFDQTFTTTYLSEISPGNGTHICIESWNLGTTEPGSSGSPLFNPEHRIIGQLHGGYASCSLPDTSDWYGRLSVSWEGGGTPASRLSDWLDPGGTGVEFLDTFNPAGMNVSPFAVFEVAGVSGGPFSPSTQIYTLANGGADPLDFSVSTLSDWLDIIPGSGSIPAGESVQVTVSISANANNLADGYYTGSVNILNTTDDVGSTSREVELAIGSRQTAWSFNMDQNPNWEMAGLWGWGPPTGQNSEHGEPDPTSGSTGGNVLGYNLAGGYTNLMMPIHMTTSPINCEDLFSVRLRFQRWLGVDAPEFDNASLSISTDGTDFRTVWANTTEITDAQWTEVEYDISNWADDNAMVFLRWTMGGTNNNGTYCGWNIDDVQLLAFGVAQEPEPEPGVPGLITILSSDPNPFSEQVTVIYTCGSATTVSARVLDLHGAVVADLGTDNAVLGENTLEWDGKSVDGKRLSSGLYIIEINSSLHGARARVTCIH